MFNNELKVQILRGLVQSVVSVIIAVLGGLLFYRGATADVGAAGFLFIFGGIVLWGFGFYFAWSDQSKILTKYVIPLLWGKPDAK